jgi:hypothetical protein
MVGDFFYKPGVYNAQEDQMYDPKRRDAEGFVDQLQAQRDGYASRIRGARLELRSEGMSVAKSNRFARWFVPGTSRDVPRTDPKSLRKYAATEWAYATAPISEYGGEYYSCCGMEDAEVERKGYARSVALEIWRTVGRF